MRGRIRRRGKEGLRKGGGVEKERDERREGGGKEQEAGKRREDEKETFCFVASSVVVRKP